MDAVKGLFAKYNAVPATNAGPDWKHATDEALLGWAEGDCQVWDANPAAHARIVDQMQDVGNELRRRNRKSFSMWLEMLAGDPRFDAMTAKRERIMAAHIAVFERIGNGRKADLFKEFLREKGIIQ